MLKKVLIIIIAVPVLAWLGFHGWLMTQPEDFRAMIRGMSTREFARVATEHFSPPDTTDHAGYGRRNYPGRGHSPWVIRSNLDEHPRMLQLALAPGYWLSYFTSEGIPYQFWQGDITFAGPAYNTRHGEQPQSNGRAFFRFSKSKINWLLKADGVWQPAQFEYAGHSMIDGGASVRMHYQLSFGGARVSLRETPDIVANAAVTGLKRHFEVVSNPTGVSVAVALPETGTGQETDGTIIEGVPTWLRLNQKHTEITHWFSEPQINIQPSPQQAGGSAAENLIAGSDCLSCHNPQERVLGPSWQEIATRYADEVDRKAAVAKLAQRVIKGGAGEWGEQLMTPHTDLPLADAERMVASILQTEQEEGALPPSVVAFREQHSYTYDASSDEPPATLHPALSVRSLGVPGFEPAVGGLALTDDGRLAVASWDRDGSVFLLDGWQDGQVLTVKRIAEGLHEPLGLVSVDGDLYVMQKQELTRLIDNDTDAIIDEYRVVSDDWQASANFHEFGFGLKEHDGWLYGGLSVCVLNGGKSCADQLEHRGRIFRVNTATNQLEFVAKGLRTPNGMMISADGDIFVTDNQGDWLPASKLVHITPGSFHGWRAPADRDRKMANPKPPVLWLPQNEVGNSPSEPLQLDSGPYKGQILFGDIYNGGIKRANLEKVNGQWQGAVLHFSGGLQAAVNRMLATPDGEIIVGQIGNPGNWGEVGKRWFGLEVLKFTDAEAFEPFAMTATERGFKVEFTQALAPGFMPAADDLVVFQWRYFPSQMYGGPKYDMSELVVGAPTLSDDRKTLEFAVAGRSPGHVVYLRLSDRFRSAQGQSLWVSEAWYTLNEIPRAKSQAAPKKRAAKSQWQNLFDGETFNGWRNYGAEPGAPVKGWEIEDGAMKMVRATSFGRFVLNFLNPFTDTPLLDLMTERKFGNFALSIDWKIAPGGNSGIFYLVPDDSARVPWKLGLEMQVLDNEGHKDGQITSHRAGDLYDLKASIKETVRPVGEWNSALIRVQGDHIQHFLNGVKVIDIRRSGPEWDAMLANSKFADRKGYGQAERGHIVLQDHGDHVWYRNIRIKELP